MEIAVAFACKPRVLLLDEPAAGVPEAERRELLDTVAALPRDVSVLLIEHDMDLVLQLRGPDLGAGHGALMAEGSVEAIANDPRVKAVYLGSGRPWFELLSLRGLTAGYGPAEVIRAIDLDLAEGESMAILGRNGTGKTRR